MPLCSSLAIHYFYFSTSVMIINDTKVGPDCRFMSENMTTKVEEPSLNNILESNTALNPGANVISHRGNLSGVKYISSLQNSSDATKL